ncbi:type II secretion system protein [Thermosediminibacter litoriperuensis]|uniref:Competence protein ComGC/general secretion pathway protein G n=1 Tax=Thermosediminibacter litoriperuensis TaxID=291989 RepID=A0A5S5AL91_9FIRM|nr:prepilin-type N-terminal cleavage/methylation domain-containing protein [Thermosediminibacter litoriperuensis]TYP51614.1 competence protein ComGC/general secretion pathway protein G [Thermosediminibacter litoriperuensis]
MIVEERGFTLLELLIVVAIITLIGTIAIPSVSELLKDSKTKIGEANAAILKNALEMYYTDKGNYPTDADKLKEALVPKYLDGKSWEKMTEQFTINYSYDGEKYDLTVTPKN